MKFLLLSLVIIFLYCSLFAQQFIVPDLAGKKWFKGNLHTHARQSESDASVEFIANWYKDHGYDFLVFTDHSTITLPETSFLTDSTFLLIPGEEIIGNGEKEELEINAINIHKAIQPLHHHSDSTVLQQCIDAVRQQNGVPLINHPNYKWRLDAALVGKVRNCNLFELYNGFPGTNSFGDDNHPGLEEVWDFHLTSGKQIYGVASDDAHSYKQFSAELSNPGRGWVMVKSTTLNAGEIAQNLDSGLFYSSTGVEIVDLKIEPSKMTIYIKESENREYTTDFIGSEGNISSSSKSNPAFYLLSFPATYVRAKITDSDGNMAWIQPVFVRQ